MMNYIKNLIPAIFFLSILSHGYSQSFEGTLTLRAIYVGEEKPTGVMKIREQQVALEVTTDAGESIRIIRDYTMETSTMLRSKDDLKYGLKTSYIPGQKHHHEVEESKTASAVSMEMTDQVKVIGTAKCTKYIFKSADAIAEAWITNEMGVHLSKYFPEFISTSVDPPLYDLRIAADTEGFITRYWEKLLVTGEENNFEMTPEAKQIPMDAFVIGADYHVYDEDGLKRLSQAAHTNEERKKEYAEFMKVFSNQ